MGLRSVLAAVSVALLACACDPGGTSVSRTEGDPYDAWVQEFADERDGWSRTYVSFLDEAQASDGSFSDTARIDWATRLGDAAGALDDALRAAGEPPTPPAGATYIHAVHAALGEAVSKAEESVSCRAAACAEPFGRLFRVSGVVEILIINARSASVLLSAPAVRDVALEDALLSPADAGAEPYDRRLSPVDVVCTPDFESDLDEEVELPEPAESQEMGGLVRDGQPVYESLYRFESKALAAAYFQVLAVRSVMCDLEPAVETDSGARLTWSSLVAPQLGTPTTGWRIRLGLGAATYDVLVLGALVDDTVAFVALGSDAGEPAESDAEDLLLAGLAGLGVSDDELAAQPAP